MGSRPVVAEFELKKNHVLPKVRQLHVFPKRECEKKLP
jgi:hypothetical protein